MKGSGRSRQGGDPSVDTVSPSQAPWLQIETVVLHKNASPPPPPPPPPPYTYLVMIRIIREGLCGGSATSSMFYLTTVASKSPQNFLSLVFLMGPSVLQLPRFWAITNFPTLQECNTPQTAHNWKKPRASPWPGRLTSCNRTVFTNVLLNCCCVTSLSFFVSFLHY